MPAPLPSRLLFSAIFFSVLVRFRLAYWLNCPPRQELAQPLGQKEPVVPDFARRLRVGFHGVAVVEVVAVELNLVIRINLGRNHLGLLLVPESFPAALPVP